MYTPVPWVEKSKSCLSDQPGAKTILVYRIINPGHWSDLCYPRLWWLSFPVPRCPSAKHRFQHQFFCFRLNRAKPSAAGSVPPDVSSRPLSLQMSSKGTALSQQPSSLCSELSELPCRWSELSELPCRWSELSLLPCRWSEQSQLPCRWSQLSEFPCRWSQLSELPCRWSQLSELPCRWS